jgi:hypothetical protein
MRYLEEFTQISFKKSAFVIKNKVLLAFLILGLIITFGLTFLKFNGALNASAQLLKEFPKIPVFPNARLTGTATDPHEAEKYNGIKYSATWSVKDKVPNVSKWYVLKLNSEGWTIDTRSANLDAYDIQLITFHNDTYTLNLSVMRDAARNLTSVVTEISTRYSDTREPGE